MLLFHLDLAANAAYFFAWAGLSAVAHSASALLVHDIRRSQECILITVVILAFSQFIFSALFPMSTKCVRPPSATFSWQLILLASTCNGIAIYTTLLSFVFNSPSTTLALKTTEPLMASVVKALLCSRLTLLDLSGLPLTVLTVAIYVFIERPQSIQVCLIPLLSNVAFACRNTMLKHSDVKQKEFLFFFVNFWPAVVAAISIDVLRYPGQFTSLLTAPSIWLTLVSGFATGVYAFISTQVILKKFSVVLHSSLNSVKRILVTFLVFIFWSYSELQLLHIIMASAPVLISLALLYRNNQTSRQEKVEEKLDWNRASLLTLMLVIPTLLLTMTSCSSPPARNGIVHSTAHPSDSMISTIRVANNRHPTTETSLNSPFTQPKWTNTIALSPGFRLAKNLIDKPHLINGYQRDLFNNVSKVLQGRKYTILMNTQCAYFGNRGDFALNYGTVLLLSQFKVKVLASCCAMECKPLINSSRLLLKSTAGLTKTNFVFIYVGGGNFGDLYSGTVTNFINIIKEYPSYDYIVFPQSPYYGSMAGAKKHAQMFEPYKDRITFLARDQMSLDRLTRQYNFTFNTTLTIDTAFAFGENSSRAVFINYVPIKRWENGLGLQKLEYLPYVDFLLFLRTDYESTKHQFNTTDHTDFTFVRGDWIHPTQKKINETDTPAVLDTYDELVAEAFWFVSRGCVMITDRLHGHIIASISQKPHVILDNSYGKLGGFYQTWTSSLAYVKYARNIDEAFKMAVLLWRDYPCLNMATNATVLEL